MSAADTAAGKCLAHMALPETMEDVSISLKITGVVSTKISLRYLPGDTLLPLARDVVQLYSMISEKQ